MPREWRPQINSPTRPVEVTRWEKPKTSKRQTTEARKLYPNAGEKIEYLDSKDEWQEVTITSRGGKAI